MQNDPNQQDATAQADATGMMGDMYTPTFGNGNFVIQQQYPGEVSGAFPVLPYFSLEALFFQQQSSNPSISPGNIMSGSHVGQQSIQGQYTVSDNLNTSRYSIGYNAG